MAKSKDLLEFYTSVLAALNIHPIDDSGLLSLRFPTEDGDFTEQPCAINDQRLALPVQARLKQGDWEGTIAFHPLSENFLRGESDIIKFLKKMVKFRLSATTSQLMMELMSIANDDAVHEDLTPAQAEFMRHLPDVSDKTVKGISKMLERYFDDLIGIYLRRNDSLDGKDYRRVAAVSFPIWEELQSKGSKIYDLDVGSAKNKRSIAALFEFIFVDPSDTEQWSAGSDANTAPYFDALLKCLAIVGKRLNALAHKYRKYIASSDALKIDLGWVDGLSHLDAWKTLIPSLPGNEGAVMKGEKEPAVPAPAASKAKAAQTRTGGSRLGFVPPAPKADYRPSASSEIDEPAPWEDEATPVPQIQSGRSQPAPVEKAPLSTGSGLNWKEVMDARRREQAAYAPQPVMGGYQRPGQFGGYPAQPVSSHMQLQMGPQYGAQPMGRPMTGHSGGGYNFNI